MDALSTAEGDWPKVPHPLLMQVFEALDEARLAWVLLRDELDLGDPDGDVDLLLAPSAAGRVRRLLRSLGFVRVPTLGRGSHVQYLGYHASDGRWVKLDIVTDLAFGPYFAFQTRAAAGCLARRQRVAGLATLAPDDAFWALLLHELIDRGHSRLKRAGRLQELSVGAETDTEWAPQISAMCPDGWTTTRIIDSVRSADWGTLEGLSTAMSAIWMRQDRLGVTARRITAQLEGVFEPALMFLHRPGFTVALLGPDGTGKSTIAAAIRRSFPFSARVVYMGLWQKPTRNRVLPGLDLLRRLGLLWGRYLTGLYYRMRGHLVIFDRYSYDALLRLGENLSRRDRVQLWILGHACPSPHLVVLLDAPAETAYKRKGEHTVTSLEADRQRFLSLAGRIPRMQIIDANRPPEVVTNDVVAYIWRRYAPLWRG